jgi:proline iminopeptidase
MKHTLFFLLFLTISSTLPAQIIYSKSYGNANNPAIVFVHGGPRGNATLFEGTTAETLASRGFYVIVYDRRGEGRSIDTTATFTFNEAFRDLNSLLTKYNLKRVSIIGHSFGGIVSTLYTEANPEKVERLILADALFSQQKTYNHILKTVKVLAEEKGSKELLNRIAIIERMDKKSAEYRKQCYEIASENGYFKMPHPTEEANQLNEQYQRSEFYKANIRNDLAPIKFYQNEVKTNIDTKPVLKNIKKKQVGLFAIYGKQDKIFSEKQLADMKRIVGENKFYLINNCSHYPFVDQQKVFLDTIEKWMKEK